MTAALTGRSRGAEAAKGLISLLGLIALVVVIPVLLVTFVGWPLPREIPTFGEITTALGDRYVPERFLIGALACVCWVVWAELVASVVVETVAMAKGRSASQVPLSGGVQKWAARLVAGAALLIALFAARDQSPAVRSLDPAPQMAQVEFGVDTLSASVRTETAEAAPANATYTVQHRDSLWDISERCMGDPFRWTDIWELNRDKVMNEGEMFTNPDLIRPGWELTLPSDAVTGAASTPSPEAAPVQAQVDTQSGIDAASAEGLGETGQRVERLDPVGADTSSELAESGRTERLDPLPSMSSTADGGNAGAETAD